MMRSSHRSHRRGALLAAVLVLLLVLPAGTALAQPSNDAFAGATVITELPSSDSVDLTGATTEAGEPANDCAPLAGSVWYEVRLGHYGIVDVDTAGSTADTVLAVYEGDSLDELRLVHCNDDNGDSPQAALSMEAFSDLTVYVQAGVFGDGVPEGSRLEITFTEYIEEPPPPVKGNRPFRLRFGDQVEMAVAEWASFTDTSSVITSIAGFDGMWYDGWGSGHRRRGQQVRFFHTHKELDERTGETVRTEYESFEMLPRTAFAFDPSMRGATLRADVPTFAYRCTTPPGGDEDDTTCEILGYPTTRFDLEWNGVGPVYRDRYADQVVVPGFRVWVTGRLSVRDARADGTVTIEGLDKPIVDGPADVFAALARTASGVSYWIRD